jgi:hypothetical protein
MAKKPLTEDQKIRAAVNAPADTFTLGDREFKLYDLPYDDYIAFVGYVSPLVDTLINRVKTKNTVGIPGIDLDVTQFGAIQILQFCGASLPEMVRLICKQTDPDITVEEIKKLVGRPTLLATIVMRQMAQNGIIQDFTDFFGQMVKTLQTFRMKQ